MRSAGASVLLVSNYLSAAGMARGYTEDFADRLESRGHAVIRTSPRPGRARRLADMVATTWRRRHDFRIAVVDVFSGAAFLWAEAVAFELRRLRKPFVLVLHGGALPEFAQRWPRRVRRLLTSATAVTAPSEYLAEAMRPYGPRIEVVANATDIARYPFAPRTAARPRMVWVRALHEMYNPALAVDVLAALAPAFPDAFLTMVGPDKDGSRPGIEQRAARLGVAERLRIVGGVPSPQIPAYLASADVFLNTTNVDNTPLSVLEAMASGLCIVSTSVGGIPYLLRDGETGLLVPPRDPVAMTRAVERILREPGVAEPLSRRARAAAERRDWSEVLVRWERLLDEVAGG